MLFCNNTDNSFCNLHEWTLWVYRTNFYIVSIYLRDKSAQVLCNALSVHMTHLFCDTARVGTDMKFGYAGTIFSRASQTQTPPFSRWIRPSGSWVWSQAVGAWRNVCLAVMFMMVNQLLGCKRKPAVTSRSTVCAPSYDTRSRYTIYKCTTFNGIWFLRDHARCI